MSKGEGFAVAGLVTLGAGIGLAAANGRSGLEVGSLCVAWVAIAGVSDWQAGRHRHA
ncbi:hypothetical protein [Rhodococcus daqingensis]|uniref:Uncharacterized protein n=1 Tax=Rhodococcus daqingensis TaxID=2479363 RepID=A0ABW2RVY1_9NOCA